jgi:multidrug efflux pump subunit AcrB
MIRRLLSNDVLVNLAFVLVLLVGAWSYQQLPRQQDPTLNFNWIVITTILPGASALDVEKKVTDPIEEALRNIKDIKFVSSNSRGSISSILVRFEDISERLFDKRVNDLRREIQNKERELPDAAEDPVILEITSANAYPSASIALVGQANDENLRLQSYNLEKALERIQGVDRVDTIGLLDPEIQVAIDPVRLQALNLTPGQVADTVSLYFQDIAAGESRIGERNWLVRIVGSAADPAALANRPVVGSEGEVVIGEVAEVSRAREKADMMTRYNGKPAVLFAVFKQADTNTIEVVDRLKAFIEKRNLLSQQTGVELVLTDDQTTVTTNAINLMQRNALIGLVLVLVVAWFFLGTRIALLTAIGIPFVLAGTFWILYAIGETLNVMVLLGIVIVLGMLVDDAVVVVESIYYRIQRGMHALEAAIGALGEVALPVLTAVLTTMAAFGPLTLVPGILGDFMKVIPIVVVLALAMSLVEAFWMLPAHVIVAGINFRKQSRMQRFRQHFTHAIQIFYVRRLSFFMRYRWWTLAGVLLMFLAAVALLMTGKIRYDFFAADTIRLYYVNVEMPPGTPLESTMEKVLEIERKVKRHIRPGEARAVISYSGQMFTEMEPRIGKRFGQVLVGLNPQTEGLRSVEEMIEAMRVDVMDTPGPTQISFLQLSGGPPKAKAISIKVRGDDYDEIRRAANDLRDIMQATEGVKDISDDASRGRSELVLSLDNDALNRTGISPAEVNRTLQLLIDGLIVAEMRHDGQKLEVRVQSSQRDFADIDEILQFRLPLPDGRQIALSSLVDEQRQPGLGNIRHYNFRRAITVEADIDKRVTDEQMANDAIMQGWERIASNYPDIDLDIEGILDDVYEALGALVLLLFVGIGLMYMILGTQFGSYWQPFMIITTVFMAFTGVVFGLYTTSTPLSLYTLYGVVALAGIAVNSSIVLISAANARLRSGMSVMHATLYAARRRVIPILITSLTTVAGLISLATGLGGKSLIWGPVATAIVWGLGFSTLLTLVVIPLLYQFFMKGKTTTREAESLTSS